MAHPEQHRFIEIVRSHLLKNLSQITVLEIGSYDVTGTVRDIFLGTSSYIGVDLIEGPGVDIVQAGHLANFPSGSQDVVLSCECFEHNPYWFETFQNMIRMAKPGGLVVFTCASRGRVEHGTARTSADLSPGSTALGWRYYRNLDANDFSSKMDLDKHFGFFSFYYIRSHADLFFFGFKKGGRPPEFDPRALDDEVVRIRSLENERFRHWGPAKRAFRHLVRLPLLAASRMLNDQAFQNFAIPYVKARDRAMELVGWQK